MTPLTIPPSLPNHLHLLWLGDNPLGTLFTISQWPRLPLYRRHARDDQGYACQAGEDALLCAYRNFIRRSPGALA